MKEVVANSPKGRQIVENVQAVPENGRPLDRRRDRLRSLRRHGRNPGHDEGSTPSARPGLWFEQVIPGPSSRNRHIAYKKARLASWTGRL